MRVIEGLKAWLWPTTNSYPSLRQVPLSELIIGTHRWPDGRHFNTPGWNSGTCEECEIERERRRQRQTPGFEI